MTNLNDLHYFVHIASLGSVTAAAGKLGIPKSTISRSLAKLERRLGVRLLERSTRRMILTEAGEIYLHYCRQAMEELSEAETTISTIRGTPKGVLRIGVPILFARIFVAPLIPGFLARYPELQLHLILGGCERNPLQADLDMLIQTGSTSDPGMSSFHLGRIAHVICASPSYLQKHGLPESPFDLQSHRCLTLKETGSHTVWSLTCSKHHVEIPLQSHFSAGDSEILYDLALEGIGIAMIPHWMAEPKLRAEELVPVLPGWEPEAVDIHVVYPTRLDPAPAVCAFLKLMVGEVTLN